MSHLPNPGGVEGILVPKMPESEEDRLYWAFLSDLENIDQEYFEKGAPRAEYNDALKRLDKQHANQGISLRQRQEAEKNALRQAWHPALSTEDPRDQEYRDARNARLEQYRSDLKDAATLRREGKPFEEILQDLRDTASNRRKSPDIVQD